MDNLAAKLNFYGGKNGGKSGGGGDSTPEAQQESGSSSSSWLPKFGGTGMAASLASAAEAAGVAGVASKGLQGVAAFTGRAKGLARTASTTISENAISRQRWMYFFGGALLGTALMALAFAFLPLIVLAPQKFALLYTLGSLCFLSSFAILRGHAAFLRHLISKSRALFTASYALSLVGTVWASLCYRSYLLTLAFSAAQVTALVWFLLSYIPGGRRALSFAFGMAWRCCRGCCGCAGKGSLLPF